MIQTNKIYQGDSLEVLKTFPDNFIDCCVTSPPYYGLRDYGMSGQIGLEETPEAYVRRLVEVFREVKRVLKKDGTLWLNLGDSYASNSKGSGGPSTKQESNAGSKYGSRKFNHGVKEKDLLGIPWMVAFALRNSGWYLRQDIIWHKPNPMPESVTDRCTKAHEYIFLLSKSRKYYFDNNAIKQPLKNTSILRLNQDVESQSGSDRVPGKTNGNMKAAIVDMANKRSVWSVNTIGLKDAHFATFPKKLITDCILAGSPKEGIILDPFMGSGTTGYVAEMLGRKWIGIELNPEYIALAEKRLFRDPGLFKNLKTSTI